MAKDGHLASVAASAVEPSLAELLDPVALEGRLKEARARRAEALARRPEPAAPVAAPAAAVVAPVLAAPARAAAAAPTAPRARPALALSALLFLAGLGLGGAVVAFLALQALPGRVAEPPQPPVVAAPPPQVASAPVVVAVAPSAALRPAPTAAAPTPSDEGPAAASPTALAAPDAPPTGTAPLPALAAPGQAPDPAPAGQPVAALPLRVVIHFPQSAAASATAAAETLRAAGVPDVEVVPVRYAIGRSNIRYYHDEDRDPAAALAPLVADALDGAAPEARDFTGYATPAAAGSVELWLAGTSAGGTGTRIRTPRRTTSTPTSAPDQPFQMPGVIAPTPTQEQQVERILIERLTNPR